MTPKPRRYPVYTTPEERATAVARLREQAAEYRQTADDYLAQGLVTLAEFANILADEHEALATELENLR